MRAIQASNGFDAAGEGGLGTSTLPGVWDSSVNTELDTAAIHTRLVTDGRILVGEDAATTLKVRGVLDGVVVATITPPAFGGSLALDDDHIYHGVGGAGPPFARIIAYSRRDSFAAIWAYDSPAGTSVPALASDGAALFGAMGSAAVTERSPRIRIANRPRLWQRVDPAVDVGIPYRRAVV